MARITEHFHVDRRPEDVFGAIADFSTASEWDPTIAEAVQAGGVRPGRGARYRLTVKMGPFPTRFVYITEIHQPTSRVVHATSNWWAWGRDDVTIRADGEGTTITWQADFALKGPGRLLDPLVQKGFERVAAKAVTGLQQWLQTGGQGRAGDEAIGTTRTGDATPSAAGTEPPAV